MSLLQQTDPDLFKRAYHRLTEEKSVNPNDTTSSDDITSPDKSSDDKPFKRAYQRMVEAETIRNVNEMGDVSRGLQRGIHGLKAAGYGAAGLIGSAIESDTIKDWGFKKYKRSSEEASKYPGVSFSDSPIDWAQGTIGELIPSMVEAAVGAGVGSLLAPGAGTVAGGLGGRFAIKTAMDRMVKQGAKKYLRDNIGKGITKETAEKFARNKINKEIKRVGVDTFEKGILRNLGAKAGVVGAVAPIESGGNWGELMEHGINNPVTSIATGLGAAFLELAGGNIAVVNRFLGNNTAKIFRKSLGEGNIKKAAQIIGTTLKQGGEEAAQEMGQEFLSLTNIAMNDPSFETFSKENLQRIFASGGAGALAGMLGGSVSGIVGKPQSSDEIKLDDSIKRLTAGTFEIPETGSLNTEEAQNNFANNLVNNISKGIINVDQLIQMSRDTKDDPVTNRIVNQVYEYIKANPNQVPQMTKPLQLPAPIRGLLQAPTEKTPIQEASVGPMPSGLLKKVPIEMGEPKQTVEDVIMKVREMDSLPEEPIIIDNIQVDPDEARLIKAGEIPKNFLERATERLGGYVGRPAIDRERTFMGPRDDDFMIEPSPFKNEPQVEETTNLPEFENTEEALAFGETATPEQIEALKRQRDDYSKQSEEWLDTGDFDESFEATKGQFAHEALSAASETAPPMLEGKKEESISEVITDPKATEEEVIAEKKKLKQQVVEGVKSGEFTGAVRFGTVDEIQDAVKTGKMPISDEYGEIHAQPIMGKDDDAFAAYGSYSKHNMAMIFPDKYVQKKADAKVKEVVINPNIPLSEVSFLINGHEKLYKFDELKSALGQSGEETLASFAENKQQDKWTSEVTPEQDKQLEKIYRIGLTGNLDMQFFRLDNPKLKDFIFAENKDNGQMMFFSPNGKGTEAPNELVKKVKELQDNDKIILIEKTKDVQARSREFDTTEQVQQLGQEPQRYIFEKIKKLYPGQDVIQGENDQISVRLNNGKGITFESVQDAGNNFIEMAIQTGQMSKNGKILGITTGNKIILDANFADNKTLWHENKHVLDNLGMITEKDDAALNREFNKLRKTDQLQFTPSTHEDPIQRMKENRANMFAQIMVNREDYRNTTFGKVIQRVLDFFDQLYRTGKRMLGSEDFQTISGLAREAESGKLYTRSPNEVLTNQNGPLLSNIKIANPWYSQMETFLNQKLPGTGTPQQLKQTLQTWAKKGEFKQAELEWSGIIDWLNQQNGKVSKQQVLDYLEENNIRIKEVMKESVNFEGRSARMDELIRRENDGTITEDECIELDNLQIDVEYDSKYEDVKYPEYTVPGGKNYKELLLTLPKQYQGKGELAQKLFNVSYNELYADQRTVVDNTHEQQNETDYKSSHWEEPNVLAHVRFNERTDADGNKVLFIEEVQSDWHQAGRKKSYGDQIDIRKDQNGYYRAYDADGQMMELRVNGEVFTALASEQAVRNALPSSFGQRGVPDAPFKKSWPLLAMKRMVRYAAENGFDKIAWTPGEVQADRYDLSKQVDEIQYEKDSDGSYDITIKKDDRDLDRRQMQSGELEEFFGKEIAEKIINGKGNQYGIPGSAIENRRSLVGVDLKVGGEGMKGFYDKMLPSIMNKEFNRGKWGKAKVGVSEIITEKQNLDSLSQVVDRNTGEPLGPWESEAEANSTADAYMTTEQRDVEIRRNAREAGVDPVKKQEVWSIPITDRMRSKALREGMPMFETREPLPEQKISDDQYHKKYQEKENITRKVIQSSRMKLSDVKHMIDKSLTPISTRLKNMGLEELSAKLRILDHDTAKKITNTLKEAYPIMKKVKKDMSPEERSAWDWARKNSDAGKIMQLARKYDFTDNYNQLRDTLNQIRENAKDVGLDIGFIEEYWPRVLKDREGFLMATQEISKEPVFTNAIKKKADELGITVEEFEQDYPDLQADIISNLILGRSSGLGGPSNIQARKFEFIRPELDKFYMDSDAALMSYIYSMTKKIEARRFFGKVPKRISNFKRRRSLAQTELNKIEELNALAGSESVIDEEKQKSIDAYTKRIMQLKDNIKDYDAEIAKYKNQRDYTENIGVYIIDLRNSGKLKKENEQAVRDILDARFHEKGATGITAIYKNAAYIDVMGNPLSALTQIGDLAWGMYVGKIWNPAKLSTNIKNFTRALFKKSKITKEDLGIERMAQEFADFDSLSRLVSKVFKYVGLEHIDSIGKEFLINNAFDFYKHQASSKTGRTKLMKYLRPIFGDESNGVINDLLSNTSSENVKVLLYSKLLDFQPVALSEMTENYLKGGNWRVLYMLKTYTIKQLDVFRNEVWRDLKAGNATERLTAMKRMIQLMGVLTFANASADELKDFLLGKETKLSDNVIENFLTMGGANRFVRMQARREGLGTAVGQLVLPPFKFVNSISKDVFTGEMIDPKKARTLESLPFIGKLAYWNVGRGSEYRPTIEEQDFRKAGKKFRSFKKQFDESDDKRLFLQSNLDEFREMKIYERFKSSERKITTLINKLKKLEQTTSVRKRIGQLTEMQNKIRQNYFSLMES